MFGQDFMELKVSEMIKFIGSNEKIVETPNGYCNYKQRDQMDDMMIFVDKIQADPQVVPQLEDCSSGDYPQEVVAESFHHSSKIVKQTESMKAAEFIVPDEHSEAGYDYHRPLRKRYESYICSSSDDEESSNAFTREVPSKTCKGSKRKRIAEASPYSSNKRQRAKINQKMRMLQNLIPNCEKVDKASVLDKAIEYLKNLQFQLQVMSMGMRPYMIASTLAMHGNANPSTQISTFAMHGNANPPMAAPMKLISQGYYNIPVNPVAVPLITTFNPPLSSLVPRLISPTASPVFPSPIGFVPSSVREYGVGFDGGLSFV